MSILKDQLNKDLRKLFEEKDKSEEPSSKIDAEVKLLMQRQDWLVNMKLLVS